MQNKKFELFQKTGFAVFQLSGMFPRTYYYMTGEDTSKITVNTGQDRIDSQDVQEILTAVHDSGLQVDHYEIWTDKGTIIVSVAVKLQEDRGGAQKGSPQEIGPV